MKKTYSRQGDILIETVTEIPPDAVKQKPSKHIVIAQGEATGHHHVLKLDDPADWWKHGDDVLVATTAPADLVHPEHATITIGSPAEIKRFRRQREYTPEEIRNVAD